MSSRSITVREFLVGQWLPTIEKTIRPTLGSPVTTHFPGSCLSENGRLRVFVQANVQGRDLGGFVEEARRRIEEQVKLGPGMTIEHTERAWRVAQEAELPIHRALALAHSGFFPARPLNAQHRQRGAERLRPHPQRGCIRRSPPSRPARPGSDPAAELPS